MSAWLLLVPLGVLGGFLAFVWHRLAVAPGWRPRWVRWAVALVLVVLTALALAGFDVWGGSFTPAQMRPAVWLGPGVPRDLPLPLPRARCRCGSSASASGSSGGGTTTGARAGAG